MTRSDWCDGLEILLEDVRRRYLAGLPPKGRYLPGWRWELEWWLMQSVANWYIHEELYREVMAGLISFVVPSIPPIRPAELPLQRILAHGLCRPVVSDEQLVRLAFTPDALNWLDDRLLAVGVEHGDVWGAVGNVYIGYYPDPPPTEA